MATRYVDSVNGSDSNDGLSPGTAKQTLTTSGLSPGDSMALAAGSKWRDQLNVPHGEGSPGSPFQVYSYGAGPMPVISGADILPTSGWSQATTPEVLPTTYVEDGFTRADQAGWGSAATGSDTNKTWDGGAVNFSISSNRGALSRDFGGMFTNIGDSHASDVESVAYFEGVPATSDNLGNGVRLRHGVSSGYQGSFQRSNNTVYIRNHYVGVTLASVVKGTIGTDFRVKMRAETLGNGNVRLRIRVWNKTDSEPSSWDLDHEDSTYKYGAGVSGIVGYNTTAASDAYVTYFAYTSIGTPEIIHTNTYVRTLATTPNGIVAENEILLSPQTSVAAVDSALGSFYWASGNLYVHSTTSDDPTTNGKTYEVAARFNCVKANAKDGVTFRGIAAEFARETGLLIHNGDRATMENCIGRKCGWQGLGITADTSHDDAHMSYCDAFENKMFSGIQISIGGTYSDLRSWNNGVDNFRDHGIYVSSNYGRQVRLKNCQSWGNAAYGIKHGQFATDGFYENNQSWGNGRGPAITDGSSSGSTWRNCTLLDGLWGFTLYSAAGAVSVDEISNCIISGASTNGIYKQGTNGGTLTLFRHNLVYGPGNLYLSDGGTANLNGGSWSNQTGTLNNLNTDPLLVDPGGGDKHLQAGSQARNAGLDLGKAYTGSAPDLGALEVGAPGQWGTMTLFAV
jgi:hypothetical protein